MPPDPADLDRFERDGYVVLPDALPATEVRRLRALTERVRRSESPAGNGAVHALGFIEREPGFATLVDQPRVLDVICSALGWNVHVYHCHLDVHPPAPPTARHPGGGTRTAAARISRSRATPARGSRSRSRGFSPTSHEPVAETSR